MDVVSQLGGLIVTISALVILIMAWVENCGDKEYRKDKQRRARESSKRFAKKAKRLKNKLRGKKTEDDEDDEDEGDDEGDEDDEGGDEDPLEVLSARVDRLDASMFQQMLGALRERVDRVENKIWTTRIDVNLDGESSDVAPNGDIDMVFAAPHDRPEARRRAVTDDPLAPQPFVAQSPSPTASVGSRNARRQGESPSSPSDSFVLCGAVVRTPCDGPAPIQDHSDGEDSDDGMGLA